MHLNRYVEQSREFDFDRDALSDESDDERGRNDDERGQAANDDDAGKPLEVISTVAAEDPMSRPAQEPENPGAVLSPLQRQSKPEESGMCDEEALLLYQDVHECSEAALSLAESLLVGVRAALSSKAITPEERAEVVAVMVEQGVSSADARLGAVRRLGQREPLICWPSAFHVRCSPPPPPLIDAPSCRAVIA